MILWYVSIYSTIFHSDEFQTKLQNKIKKTIKDVTGFLIKTIKSLPECSF